jgi:Fe2+ transport system protein B
MTSGNSLAEIIRAFSSFTSIGNAILAVLVTGIFLYVQYKASKKLSSAVSDLIGKHPTYFIKLVSSILAMLVMPAMGVIGGNQQSATVLVLSFLGIVVVVSILFDALEQQRSGEGEARSLIQRILESRAEDPDGTPVQRT